MPDPTLGRVVHYSLSAQAAAEITRRRHHFRLFNRKHQSGAEEGEFPGKSGHIGHVGSDVKEGDIFPAIVVRVHSATMINLQVLLDGNDTLWVTSPAQGDEPGTWKWPVIA